MDHEVLIAGAGPTGLVLALWLTQQGIRVRIVDPAPGPGTTSRAMAVQARTLELYRQLDLAAAAVAHGKPNPSVNIWVKGKKRAHVSFEGAGHDITPYPFVLIYPQDRHEQMLVAKLAALGVTVERKTALVRFEDTGDAVQAYLKGPDGAETLCRVAYLAGCDGAHSTVRQQLHTGFPGGTYSQVFYVADVEISGPVADGEVHIALDTSDFLAVMAYDAPGLVRLIGTVTDPHAASARDASTHDVSTHDTSHDTSTPAGSAHDASDKTLHFEDVSHRAISHLGLTIEKVNWFSTYHVHHRVTDHYRVGRAFLLGDAAHIHSPAGGQGMNTGIGDAINLAWKLAAVLRQHAPDTLLDIYEQERRAFAERLVQTTDRVFSFATSEGSFANFVRTQIAPYLLPVLYRPEAVRETMFRILSQTMIEYRDSAISAGAAGAVHGGDRLPWVRPLQEGQDQVQKDQAKMDQPGKDQIDNYDSLRHIEWQVHVYGLAQTDLIEWCAQQRLALHVFAWTDAHHRAGLAENALYLIRPDSYVAFADAKPGVEALANYVRERGLELGDGYRR